MLKCTAELWARIVNELALDDSACNPDIEKIEFRGACDNSSRTSVTVRVHEYANKCIYKNLKKFLYSFGIYAAVSGNTAEI